MTIFTLSDADTGDAIAIEADGGRLLLHSIAAGRSRTMICADGVAVGLELADALQRAFTIEEA